MYDLRHTFASLLLASSAPITYVAAQLGHTKPTTTLRYYAKWIPKEGLRYVDVLDTKPDVKEAVSE
jgi:integrase